MEETANQISMLAKTMFGLEPVLEKELIALGAQDIVSHNRAISFTGDKELLYKVNLWSRTATRILVPIKTDTAHTEETLYNAAKRIDWSKYLKMDQTFAVHTALNTELFNHSLFVSLKVKDAIVDQFREKHGERPSVDKDHPDITIQVHIFKNQITFLLDSSGNSLHKRGYKVGLYKANLNECLAAGMILLSEWDTKQPFYDPMCGSGTLLTEAAMIAKNIAPGLYRSDFGFMHWQDFDDAIFKKVVQEAQDAETETTTKIMGSDVSMVALKEAKENLESAEVDDVVTLTQINFEQGKAPIEAGLMMMNPPYGERIEKEDIIKFYTEIGNTLKREYAGWTAWIFSGNLDAFKFVGLKPSRKIPLFNGPIECRLNRFNLYQGSKKASKQDADVTPNSSAEANKTVYEAAPPPAKIGRPGGIKRK